MNQVLVTIFVCVVLPIAIILIKSLTTIKSNKLRAEILIKAIESGSNLDTDRLAEALKPVHRSATEILNLRLLRGCLFSFIGLALIIVALVMIAADYNMADDPIAVPLIFGGCSLAIGASYLVVYFMTRNQTVNGDGR